MRDQRRQTGITLIELLVGMTIATLLSGMVLMGWFALQDSYSSSVSSDKAREYARDGMSRMVRELRDARAASNVLYSVQTATSTTVAFTSSFNDAKAATDIANQMLDYGNPRLVTYRYDATAGTLYRSLGSGTPQALVTNVVNAQIPSPSSPSTPVFTYTYLNASTGQLVVSTSVPDQYRASILSVRVHLLVDLNPGRSPVHMDLVSTAQLRNMRNL
jgi:Tfp pilus assembly protein PilW